MVLRMKLWLSFLKRFVFIEFMEYVLKWIFMCVSFTEKCISSVKCAKSNCHSFPMVLVNADMLLQCILTSGPLLQHKPLPLHDIV